MVKEQALRQVTTTMSHYCAKCIAHLSEVAHVCHLSTETGEEDQQLKVTVTYMVGLKPAWAEDVFSSLSAKAII